MCAVRAILNRSGNIGIREGEQGREEHVGLPSPLPPPRKSGKYFSGNYYEKFGNFVNFSDKYHIKFGHFVNISYIIFGQKCLAPEVD